MTDLPIVTASGGVPTQRGHVLIILHQSYAHIGKTIHLSVQLGHFQNVVDDRFIKIPGATQSITTLEGYTIPLHF